MRRKRLVIPLGAALAAAALAGGCGSGGSKPKPAATPTQQVRTAAFGFSAPTGWRVVRAGSQTTVHAPSGPTLASVTPLLLRRRYRPALFREAALALDRVTSALADRLGGKVIARRTLAVGGIRARQYDVAYSRRGSGLIDRITYVLRDRTEYELLCRWPAGAAAPQACSLLTASFRIR